MITRQTFEYRQRINEIVLVGCGGTGSALARHIARIVWDMKARRLHTPTIKFIDPDQIELKNCGRQAFLAAEIGQFKTSVLARRFNFAYGLEIAAYNEPFDAEKHASAHGTLLVGAVDNHLARRELARKSCLWLDTGNSLTSGQSILGCSRDLATLRRNVELEHCYALPTADVIFPELLEPEPAPAPVALSCAEQVEAGSQHLLVNDLVALSAANYIFDLLHMIPIPSFMTLIDLTRGTRALPICKAELMPYLQRCEFQQNCEKNDHSNRTVEKGNVASAQTT